MAKKSAVKTAENEERNALYQAAKSLIRRAGIFDAEYIDTTYRPFRACPSCGSPVPRRTYEGQKPRCQNCGR